LKFEESQNLGLGLCVDVHGWSEPSIAWLWFAWVCAKKAIEGCSRLRRDGDFSFVSFLCMAGKEKIRVLK
jgi:hypothetical protein